MEWAMSEYPLVVQCPYCGDPLEPGELTAIVDGERMHVDCASNIEADAHFDDDLLAERDK
jgi:hypothetical protein